MEIVKITDSLFESNCYVIFSDDKEHCLIIDPNDFKQIRDNISDDVTVDYILLTHEHYDHLSALNECREYYGAKVIASQACSNQLPNIQKINDRTYRVYLHFFGKDVQYVPQYNCECAEIIFHDKFIINWQHHSVEIIEKPGHSLGDVLVFIDAKYLISGDTLLKGKTVITKYLNGDINKYSDVVLPYLKQLDKQIIVFPGHGNQFRLGDKVWDF